MKIAIPYENGQVFQHFGHSAQFKLYTAEEGRITGAEVVSTDGQGHGALVGFLVRSGVNVLLCGGIGGGAQMALAQAGIRLCGGITGNADSAAAAYLSGTLVFDPNARCTHHDHEESHSCGAHACHADKGGCTGSCAHFMCSIQKTYCDYMQDTFYTFSFPSYNRQSGLRPHKGIYKRRL